MKKNIGNNSLNDNDFESFDYGNYLHGYDAIKQNAIQAVFCGDKLSKISVDGKVIDFSSENKAFKETKNIIERFFNFNLRVRYN